MRRVCLELGLGLLMAVSAAAQVPAAAVNPVGGTVTGRLTFAETQLPARFAEVVLVRKPEPGDLPPDHYTPPKKTDPAAPKPPEKVMLISGRSGLDGSYSIAEVPPGDYYAIPKMHGYVVPIGTAANEKEARDIEKLAAQLATVRVDVGKVAVADLVLHRGAVISGRVLFQDGSPVVGVAVRAESQDAAGEFRPMYAPLVQAVRDSGDGMGAMAGYGSSVTDDEGRYRLAGLAAGRYRVAAELHTRGGMRMVQNGPGGLNGSPTNGHGDLTVTVYQPGVVGSARGKVFEVKDDERVADADISVDLSGLHTVRGRVLAKEDRHVLTSTYVRLTEDGGKGFGMHAQVERDGTFAVEYVPAGTYQLFVSGEDYDRSERPAKDGAWFPKSLRSYASLKVPVIVGEHDVTVDEVLLVEAKKGEVLVEDW